MTPRLQDQIKHDRTIKFSNLQLFKIFVCCGKSKERRLYNKGISKLSKDLDLLSIIRNLKHLKVMLKSKVNPEYLVSIFHSSEHVIEIDSPCNEESLSDDTDVSAAESYERSNTADNSGIELNGPSHRS